MKSESFYFLYLMLLPPPNELSILPNAVVIPHAEQVNSASTIKNNENQPKIPYIYTTYNHKTM